VEEIARAVGIARGLIYRQFSSKEELYVLTVTDYLDELEGELRSRIAGGESAEDRLERCAFAYAGFCQHYPAFLDASLSLMHRPARDLQASISESVWLRLGDSMSRCIGILADLLRDPAFAALEDPDFMANLLWTQMLGVMHLARIRVGMRRGPAGGAELFRIEPDDVVRACVRNVMAASAPRP
jgi:AcrR family transcriptional regulator